MKIHKLSLQRRLLSVIFFLLFPVFVFSQNGGKNFIEGNAAFFEDGLTANQINKVKKLKQDPTIKKILGLKIEKISRMVDKNDGLLPIKLPGIDSIAFARPNSFEYTSDDDYIWMGKFRNGSGQVIINSKDGKASGHIEIGDKIFDFYSFNKNKSILLEYDTQQVNQVYDAPPLVEVTPVTPPSGGGSGGTKIRILILYTPAAESYLVDPEGHAMTANSMLNSAIQYSIPGDSITCQLAGCLEYNFTERWDSIQEDIDSFAVDAGVASLRNSYNADLVVLLTDGWYGNYEYPDTSKHIWAGVAADIGPNEPYAFAIVEARYSISNKTYPHEVGHLFGCRHEYSKDPEGPYEHGYIFTVNNETLRTIMAIGDQQPRVNYFSNPDLTYPGSNVPMGTSTANNALKIKNTASTVANFRPDPSALEATISGTTSGGHGYTFTFTSSLTGGAAYPYNYCWNYSSDGINYSGYYGSTPSITIQLPSSGTHLYLKLTVTSADSQSAIDYHGVNLDQYSPRITDYENESVNVVNLREIDFIPFKLFPNPVNGLCEVQYTTTTNSKVYISVFDLGGRQLQVIFEANQIPGNYSLKYDTSSLSEGIYYIVLKVGNQQNAKKLFVIK